MIAEMVEDGFTLYDSFYVTCKGIGGTDGAKALKTIFDNKITSDDSKSSDESED